MKVCLSDTMQRTSVLLFALTSLSSAASDPDLQCTKPHEEAGCVEVCPPERSCRIFHFVIPCVPPTQPCKPQCVCVDGFARNVDGICITLEQCDQCPGYSQYFVCNGPYDPQCEGACRCDTGYSPAGNGTCIRNNPPPTTVISPPPPPSTPAVINYPPSPPSPAVINYPPSPPSPAVIYDSPSPPTNCIIYYPASPPTSGIIYQPNSPPTSGIIYYPPSPPTNGIIYNPPSPPSPAIVYQPPAPPSPAILYPFPSTQAVSEPQGYPNPGN